jgi:hypothetical protein
MVALEMGVRKRIIQRESEKSASQGADDLFKTEALRKEEIRDAVVIRETHDAIIKNLSEQREAFMKKENEMQDAWSKEIESLMDEEFNRRYKKWWDKHWPRLERASKKMNDALLEVIFEIGFNERSH